MKKKRTYLQAYLLFLAVLSWDVFAAHAAEYSGGAGTEAEPYQISVVADWITLTSAADDWDKHFILTVDLDFAGTELTPVGDFLFDQGFDGVFEGDGHHLRNAQVNFPVRTYVGLFGYLSPTGKIRNLGVENISVSGRYDTGCLVGKNDGAITTCRATGEVTGDGNLGCLAGSNDGFLTSCCAAGTVMDRDEEYSQGMGILVGSNWGAGVITSCYASGTVVGSSENSFALGGLVGQSEGAMVSCYALGSVAGRGLLGGLVGFSAGTITTCYAVSTLTWTEEDYFGGLVGRDLGATSASYWDSEFSGLVTSSGGEGRTTDEMTYPAADNTYVGWDFTTVWVADTEYNRNDGYPYLRDCPPAIETEGEMEEGEGEGEANVHPADLNADWRIRMSEAIAYLTGWQYGTNPMDYAIRAVYLWQHGEYYMYDNTFMPPLCWVLGQ